MLRSKAYLAIAFIITATAAAALTYAFSSPVNRPHEANSSSGSMIKQILGAGFDADTDSLSAIGDLLTDMGLISNPVP